MLTAYTNTLRSVARYINDVHVVRRLAPRDVIEAGKEGFQKDVASSFFVHHFTIGTAFQRVEEIFEIDLFGLGEGRVVEAEFCGFE